MSFREHTGPFGSAQAVSNTVELQRIVKLERREAPTEATHGWLVEGLTKELKTPNGKQTLRFVQALALFEMLETGGLFGPIVVGGGKTLISLLAPLVLEAKRPILLLPASLIEKTWHDRSVLAEHWYLPTNLQFISYESLSLVQNVKKLDYILPDLIIADEAHYISSKRSGRSRRIARYMHEHPDTKIVAMSGTMMKKSIRDFAPVARWALKEQAPVPKTEDELGCWAEALDEGVNPLQRRKPGALMLLDGGGRQQGTVEEARQIFQRRLLETKGVVSSFNTNDAGCSILIKALEYKSPAITEQHFRHIRATWQTPDGWDFMQAVELRMYLRQIALDFHGVWDPRPPPEWLEARKAWSAFARNVLKSSKTLDTPLAVANAIHAKLLDDGGVLAKWKALEKTFTIQPKPVWHADVALNVAAKWAEEQKGLVWVEHRFFGAKLASMLKCSYYGPGGLDDQKHSIKDARPGRPAVASVAACSAGFNLQMFSRNLITSCPSGSSALEQLIGRTHRPGQEADEVVVDIMVGCAEQVDAFERAKAGAEATEGTIGHMQKLLLADVVMPDVSRRRGPLWGDIEECGCKLCRDTTKSINNERETTC